MRQCSLLKYMACSCGMQNAPTGAGGGVPPPIGHKQKQRACARECWVYPFEELAPHFLHEHRDREVSFSLGKEGGNQASWLVKGRKRRKDMRLFFSIFLEKAYKFDLHFF